MNTTLHTGESYLSETLSPKNHLPPPITPKNNLKQTFSMSSEHIQKGAQYSRVWEEFYSPNFDPNWQKSKKTRGVGWENEHKKLSCEPNPLHLAYNIPLSLLYRSPPLTTLTSHYVHRNSGAHLTKTTTTASKEDNDQMEEDRSFFLPQNLRF